MFSRDRPRLREGCPSRSRPTTAPAATGTIDYLAPVGNRASQSVTARVVLDNADGRWTPGQFVEGRVTIAHDAGRRSPCRCRRLQRFRDFDVVFAQVGDVYEVRMLDARPPRRRATSRCSTASRPAPTYVTDNSYLIKADIEKAGASHDH